MNLLQQQPINWRPLYKLGVKRCPVCSHKDNCSGARDETGELGFVYCRRPSENRTGLSGKPGRDGGATFVLNRREPSLTFPRKPLSRTRLVGVVDNLSTTPLPRQSAPHSVVTGKPEPIRADADHAHEVYSALLDSLPLQDCHRSKMVARGLSRAEVDHLVLRSAPRPEECGRVAEALAPRDIKGVAGFYRARGRWFLRDLGAGVLIPVKDSRERIRGLLLRRDEGALRYVWLSTPPDRFEGGASTGAPAHFVRCNRIRETGQALISEGALKSSIISFFLNCGVIGVAGVSTFTEDFGVSLCEELPELRHVTICYDNDWVVKPPVRKALFRLQGTLRRAGLRWSVRKFPSIYKGFDDYLAATTPREEVVA